MQSCIVDGAGAMASSPHNQPCRPWPRRAQGQRLHLPLCWLGCKCAVSRRRTAHFGCMGMCVIDWDSKKVLCCPSHVFVTAHPLGAFSVGRPGGGHREVEVPCLLNTRLPILEQVSVTLTQSSHHSQAHSQAHSQTQTHTHSTHTHSPIHTPTPICRPPLQHAEGQGRMMMTTTRARSRLERLRGARLNA